jgi:hypothetical protein
MSDVLRLIPPDPISPFVKLTTPFDKDVTKAVYAGHASSPDDPLILNLVRKYQYEVFHTSLPDRIFPILQTYELDVLKIFFPIRTLAQHTALDIPSPTLRIWIYANTLLRFLSAPETDQVLTTVTFFHNYNDLI